MKSQALPIPSLSASAWPALDVNWQLSSQFVVAPPVHGSKVPSPSLSGMPSLSSSGSHALPEPSPSALSWSGLAIDGQLSQASPSLSPSVSVWVALDAVGQLSQRFPAPSPSLSAWSGLKISGHLSEVVADPVAVVVAVAGVALGVAVRVVWKPVSSSAWLVEPSALASQ